jgi:hypothetical protein
VEEVRGDVIPGSCLCGEVSFEVTPPLGEVRLCHCDLCRRANGSAFSANTRIQTTQYRLLCDGTTIKEYQSSPGAWRAFCNACGSPVYARVASDPGYIRIRLGTLPRNTSVTIAGHVWIDSKASWEEINSDLPQFPCSAVGSAVDGSE